MGKIKIKKRSASSSGRRLDSDDTRRREDAALSVFFQRELEQIKRKTFDKKYPDLFARTFVPYSPEPASPGAESITYRSFDRKGMMKVISGYATELQRVDVIGSEFTSAIKSIGGAIGWNRQEIRAAEYAGKPLKSDRMKAARRAAEEAIDEIITFGQVDTALPGFLNNANVPQASVTGGTWATKASTDPDLIIDDVADAIGDMQTLTKDVEKPDTLLVTPEAMTLLSLTRLVDQNVSVLTYLKEALRPLGITTIESWSRLKGAGSGGTDRMVLYRRDPDCLFYEVPMEFTVYPEQWRGLEAIVPCEARVGGTIIPYPLSVSYRDGI